MTRERLKQKARELGLTGAEAAKVIGASLPSWNNWVSGRATPRQKYASAIDAFLNLSEPPPWVSSTKQGRAAGRRASKLARAAEMAGLYAGGKTLQEIGEQFGVTRERVRQLLKFSDVTAKCGGASVKAERARAERMAKIDAIYRARFGLPRAEYWAIPAKARLAYSRQKVNAAKRGIEWALPIADWWEIWVKSGKWEQRGRGQGYCMGRKGDCGPYSRENVYICTIGQNFSDSYLWKPAHQRARRGTVRKYEFNGHELTLSELSRLTGIPAGTLRARIVEYGWTVERATTEAVHVTSARFRRSSSERAVA